MATCLGCLGCGNLPLPIPRPNDSMKFEDNVEENYLGVGGLQSPTLQTAMAKDFHSRDIAIAKDFHLGDTFAIAAFASASFAAATSAADCFLGFSTAGFAFSFFFFPRTGSLCTTDLGSGRCC